MSITDQRADVRVHVIGLIRTIALGGLAAAITGVVVFGVGGRVVMLTSRLLHPEAVGRITENCTPAVGPKPIPANRISSIVPPTVNSPTRLIWVLVRQWIPDSAVLVGLGAVAIGGSLLIQSDNTDFVILEGPQIDLVLLVSLVFVFGVSLRRPLELAHRE